MYGTFLGGVVQIHGLFMGIYGVTVTARKSIIVRHFGLLFLTEVTHEIGYTLLFLLYIPPRFTALWLIYCQ